MRQTAANERAGFTFYMHDRAAAFRFQLSGNLAGDSVRNLEQAWRTAVSVIRNRPLEIDLSGLTGIDGGGRDLLDIWYTQGARLVTVSLAAKERIERLIGREVLFEGKVLEPSVWEPVNAAMQRIFRRAVRLLPGSLRGSTRIYQTVRLRRGAS